MLQQGPSDGRSDDSTYAFFALAWYVIVWSVNIRAILEQAQKQIAIEIAVERKPLACARRARISSILALWP